MPDRRTKRHVVGRRVEHAGPVGAAGDVGHVDVGPASREVPRVGDEQTVLTSPPVDGVSGSEYPSVAAFENVG